MKRIFEFRKYLRKLAISVMLIFNIFNSQELIAQSFNPRSFESNLEDALVRPTTLRCPDSEDETENQEISIDLDPALKANFACSSGKKNGPFRIANNRNVIDQGYFKDDQMEGNRTLNDVGIYLSLKLSYKSGEITGPALLKIKGKKSFTKNLNMTNGIHTPREGQSYDESWFDKTFSHLQTYISNDLNNSRQHTAEFCQRHFINRTEFLKEAIANITCENSDQAFPSTMMRLDDATYRIHYNCVEGQLNGLLMIDKLNDARQLFGYRESIVEVKNNILSGRYVFFEENQIMQYGKYENGRMNDKSFATKVAPSGMIGFMKDDLCESGIVTRTLEDREDFVRLKKSQRDSWAIVPGYAAASGFGHPRNGPDITVLKGPCNGESCMGVGLSAGIFNLERREYHLSLALGALYMGSVWIEVGAQFREGRVRGFHADYGFGYFLMPFIELGNDFESNKFNLRGGLHLKLPFRIGPKSQ
ncbi:MAG: hypothetical protein NT027_19490 [Proteobacteria bacterium]|nr:hypothetical protein [Pseudomonadota bacterium]